jgi:membrane-associated phospholipid phosphatase
MFLVCGGSLVALAAAVKLGGVFPIERAIYAWIISLVPPSAIPIFEAINYLGDKRLLLPATLLLLWLAPARTRRWWWLWGGVMLFAPLLEGAGKEIIGRPRPVGDALGFPSGHVTAASAYFSLAAYIVSRQFKDWKRVLWITAGLTVTLVGIARMVLRAHWPADFLGGAALGLAVASLAFWWYESAEDRRLKTTS